MNRPIRVAWITFFPVEWLPEAPEEIRALPKGHPASWQRVLLRELQKDPSIELHIFAIRKQFQRDVIFTSGNATFYCMKAPGSLRAPSLFWTDTWLLRPYMKRIRPDVIHAWGMEQAAGLVASRLGCPYVVTMQGIFGWLKTRTPLNRYQKLMALLESRVLPKAPKVTVEARFAVDFLRERYPQIQVEQVEHAPDPIFSQTVRKNDPQKLRFLSIGAINELKGADLLLKSLAQFGPELAFDLVAIASPQSPLLERLRTELPASLFNRVQFKEGLSPAQMVEEMAQSTILIYPTRGDTSPNAVKEAVVHGLPVVAAEVGGIPDYLVDGENGILLSPGNMESLTNGIRRAIEDPHFAIGLVDSSRLLVSRNYLSSENMAEKFQKIYQSLQRA